MFERTRNKLQCQHLYRVFFLDGFIWAHRHAQYHLTHSNKNARNLLTTRAHLNLDSIENHLCIEIRRNRWNGMNASEINMLSTFGLLWKIEKRSACYSVKLNAFASIYRKANCQISTFHTSLETGAKKAIFTFIEFVRKSSLRLRYKFVRILYTKPLRREKKNRNSVLPSPHILSHFGDCDAVSIARVYFQDKYNQKNNIGTSVL